MKALVYRRSVVLYLAGRALSSIRPRSFYPWLAPLRLTEVPVPKTDCGWITLRSRMCGICGSDLGLLRGKESFLMEPYASLPAVLGHETTAEVVAAPEGSGWKPQDRVVVEPMLSCAERGLTPCRFCAQGFYNLCENFASKGNVPPGPVMGYNAGFGGGMAEYMLASSERLIRVAEGVTDERAVLADSLASALQPALDHFPKDGDTVVIFGAGIIGQHLIRIFRALGSSARLVVIARHPFQQELARQGGADLVLASPKREDIGKAVRARVLPTTLGGGNLEGGADIVFDCVAGTHTFQESLLALRGRGTYVMVGTAGTLGPVDVSSLWFRELRVIGTSCYSFADLRGQRVRTYQKAMEMLAGNYPCEGLLTHVYPLSDFKRAFKTAFDKSLHKSVKVAIDLRTEKA